MTPTNVTATAQTVTPLTSSMRAGKTDSRPPKALPAPNSDFYQLADVLTVEEKAIVKKVRTYLEAKVQPIINKYWSDDAFPFELLPSFKELGLGGLGYEGYGCAGGSQKLFGFVAMEMARVDASFCTFWGVHSGLAMGSIYLDGSEEQKQKWLPPMARFEKIGCFGLTEPLVGSGTSGGMTTTAKREGDTWVLNGQKRWIGNAPWCDISIIWARDLADNQVKGFIVEDKTTPGFSVEKIEHKIALKVVQNGQITLKDVRLPEANRQRQLLPRHRARAADDPLHGGLGLDRRADGRLRTHAQVCPGAIAVRQADRLVPDGAGSPRQDARQCDRVPMHDGATGLPDMPGQELLQRIRTLDQYVPIVVLSGRSDEAGKVQALDSGADDYLTKPFGMGELLARIRAARRHQMQTNNVSPIFRTGNLSADFVRRIVKLGNNEIKLTPKKYDLLWVLAQHAGKVLTHRFLIGELWNGLADAQYLRVYVRQLRQKIEIDPAQPQYLMTETGVGYRLQAPT